MAVQQGRSDANERGVPVWYVELLRDARTPPAVFFRILLGLEAGHEP